MKNKRAHKAIRKVNKTLRLNSKLLNEAKKVLGYATDTEAIEETLRIALNNKKHLDLLQKYHGKLKFFKTLYD